MLTHPTVDKLHRLKLPVMAQALLEQIAQPSVSELSFEERLGLLVDREMMAQDTRRMNARLKKSRLGRMACLEDLDTRSPRGLDRSLIRELASGDWIKNHRSVLITGPTGVGKTYLGQALGVEACRIGFTCLSLRAPRLFSELGLARATGKLSRLLASWAKIDLMVIDDFLLAPLSQENRHDLLEILEDRWDTRATLVTSQYPVETWHDRIGDPTLADAILDRLIHQAYRIALKGDSLRAGKRS